MLQLMCKSEPYDLFMLCTLPLFQVTLRFSCTNLRVPRWTTRRCFTSECCLSAGTLRRAKRRRTRPGSESCSRTLDHLLSSPSSNRQINRNTASTVRCTWRHGATPTITITSTTPYTSGTASMPCPTPSYPARFQRSVLRLVMTWAMSGERNSYIDQTKTSVSDFEYECFML